MRATCHGLSAAAGKIGAVLGAAVLKPVRASVGLMGVLLACAAVAAVGAVVTYFFVQETCGMTLEEIAASVRPEDPDSSSGSVVTTRLIPRVPSTSNCAETASSPLSSPSPLGASHDVEDADEVNIQLVRPSVGHGRGPGPESPPSDTPTVV